MNQSSNTIEENKRPGNQSIIKNNEIDVIALAHSIWDDKKTIIHTVIVVCFIGLMVALFSPVKYTASTAILPQAEGQPDLGGLGGLGGLVGMAGVNLESMMGSATGIQPDLYPRVIDSYPFLNELLHQPFNFEDEEKPVSIFEKELQDSILSLGEGLLKYTVRLPWTIKNALFDDRKELKADFPGKSEDIILLSKEESDIFVSFTDVLEIEVDKDIGLVSISVELGEPLLTAQVAKKTVELLQKYIIEYKTRQAAEDLAFIEARFKEKRVEFENAREAFFEYRDRNRNVVEERTNIRYQELNDNYTLAREIYQSLSQQKEQAEISVKKDTPAFSVIEPVKVPVEKTSPRRFLIMVISFFLGVLLGVSIILGRKAIGRLRRLW